MRVQTGLLRHVGDAQVLLQLQGAVVGLFKARQNFEQRRFAGAVAANQAYALVGLQRKICVVQQGDVPKSKLSVKKGNECHMCVGLSRVRRAGSVYERFFL